MIKLETEFVSSAGGFGSNPLAYKQLKRTDTVAIYERSHEDGRVLDFEVFIIKIDPKGKVSTFPNGTIKILEDDTEHYPTICQWGHIAWSSPTLEEALKRFENIVNPITVFVSQPKHIKPPTKKENHNMHTNNETISIPDGEFSTKELMAANSTTYPNAVVLIKVAIAKGTIKFVREERRSIKGPLTKLYVKLDIPGSV